MNLQKTVPLPSPIREGWGLTHRIDIENGTPVLNYYVSDGTEIIYVMDSVNFTVKRKIPIFDKNNQPRDYLNELEFIEGRLWANIYLTNMIAVINIETGQVEEFIDFTELVQYADQLYRQKGLGSLPHDRCLNGIAYDAKSKHLYITGKKWHFVAEISLN
eukprot:TRINITY_DN4649_c0_g1_i1.p1 TRINITY_DN4649_c0_g1~~TRINITY_DN4649_c0_g1_i1.p1  ORF type:complete len:160 (-),score=35.58 TRINITY_DN4649_c0_g1_i1:127-606(-)